MGKHIPVKTESGEPVIYWNENDYMRIACAMHPLLERGMRPQEALAIAQRLLPKAKQRPADRLKRPLYSDHYVAAVKRIEAMTPDERALVVAKLTPEQLAELAPPKTAKTPKTAAPQRTPRPEKLPTPVREKRLASNGRMRSTSIVRHTDIELALIARRVAHFQIDLKDTRPLSRLFKIAQAIELPLARHRTSGSIDAGLARIRDELVRVHVARLVDGVPFDATRRKYVEPAGSIPDTPHPIPQREAAPVVATPQSAPTRQEAPAPVQAPTPAPFPRSSLGDPIRAFGDAFASSMHTLLHAMTHEMMSELELRVSAMSERLMQRTVETIAQGIGPLVHSALERELGGAVSAPAQVDAPMSLPTGSALPKSLQLDVVGLIGSQVTEVRDQLNGYAAGMRFINADDVGGWTPRQTVILNTKFISHNAENKCRKAGVKPIRVQGGAGAILNAIRTLCENEGISLPQHH